MNALTVCVEFDDLLAITLAQNRRHFDRFLVITSLRDEATVAVAKQFDAEWLCTDAFFTEGAPFAKGLAVEEGFETLGRQGWICVLDADVILPPGPDWLSLRYGNLYGPRRRLYKDASRPIPSGLDWSTLPRVRDTELAGYCQIFHASDPVLRARRPWYGIRWRHAGGCDSDFQALWPARNRLRPAWEVLHLGDHGENWCGRSSPRTDGTLPPRAAERAQALATLREERKTYGYLKELF